MSISICSWGFIWSLALEDLHNALGIPDDWIGVEISSWVEPEIELLLSVALSLAEHIGVNYVRIAAQIAQKLEIYFIPRRPFWTQLQIQKQNP